MSARRYFSIMARLVTLMAVTGPAVAATVTINLAGDVEEVTVRNDVDGFGPFNVQTLNLINMATGTNQVPGFEVAIGDIINGTVTLNDSLIVPAFYLQSQLLFRIIGNGTANYIQFNQALTYYNRGVQVSPPAGSAGFGGTGSEGIILGDSWRTETERFAFDQIVYSATIVRMLDTRFQNLNSATLSSAAPYLQAWGYVPQPPPVPLPGAAWLLLSGLGGLSLLTTKRRTS